MRYQMIAIDLDGTALNRQGHISEANRRAIEKAQQAGVLVVPCTGRAWSESRTLLKQMPDMDLGVFVTGAVVAQTKTGKSLDLAVIEPCLAYELVEFLKPQPDAVLVFREAALCGHDYLVTGQGQLTSITQWWFQLTGATKHHQPELTHHDLHHTLRVGLVAEVERITPLTHHVRQVFADRVLAQSFGVFQLPDDSPDIHVLEIFAQGVDKWRGLMWIAQQQGISPNQIAAIGDEINDVTMVRSAACGIAMGNAAAPVKEVADYVTLDCDEDGVAHAIEQLLAEQWG